MKKIKILTITVIIIILLSILTFSIVTKDNQTENKTMTKNTEEQINTKQYTNTIEITQQEIQLDYEVIQYKIIFHEDDTINVYLYGQILSKSLGEKLFLISITDGRDSIIQKIDKNHYHIFLIHLPVGRFEITTPRFKFVGKLPLIFKLRNVGLKDYCIGDVDVKKNDTWYLTIAVVSQKETDIQIKLKSENKSMELLQIERHSKLGFYSANHNDFDGKYYSISYGGFGITYAKNLNKKIETTDGSFIYFSSISHKKGDVKIQTPDKTILSSNNKKVIQYIYIGNNTGVWSFTANGRNLLGFKYMIILFYIDINTYSKEIFN